MYSKPSILDGVIADHEASYDTRTLWPGYWHFMALIENRKEKGRGQEEKETGSGH